MNAVGTGIISITSGAILCGILKYMYSTTEARSWADVLCGAYMLLVLLSMFKQIDVQELLPSIASERYDVQKYISNGEQYAQNTVVEIIKENCEAYVMEQANQMDIPVTVEIMISDTDLPAPVGIYISGQVSPYEKAAFGKMLEEDLGISREAQIWRG